MRPRAFCLPFALLLWAIHGVLAVAQEAEPDKGEEGTVLTVTPEGTECFRYELHRCDIQPIKRSRDIWANPSKTIIVLLGDESVRQYLTGDLIDFVNFGGVLVVASDRTTRTTPLRRMFGVDITGEIVRVAAKDAYGEDPTWPFVRPRGIPWLPVAKNSPDELFRRLEPSGANALVTCNSSIVLRTLLPNGAACPLQPLAGYPLSANVSRRGKIDAHADLFAAGGTVGAGQVLVLGDHSIFCNLLILADDNANCFFAQDLVRWMQESGTEKRTRCLFVEDGVIKTEFELPTPEIPFPVKFNAYAAAGNELIPELQNKDFFNRFAIEWLEDQDVTWRMLLRGILLVVTILFMVYCMLRMIDARTRLDPARSLVNASVLALIPRGGVLRQRIEAPVDADNLYASARDMIRDSFDRLSCQPDEKGNPPAIWIQDGHADPKRLRKIVMRLWNLAYGSRPVVVSPQYWHQLNDELDEVLLDAEDGWWKFQLRPKHPNRTVTLPRLS